MQVIWNRLYKEESFCDKGTLKHLANIIRRSNVPKKVKNNFSAAQDFYSLIVDAHIVAAAMAYFGLDSTESIPTGVVVLDNQAKAKEFMLQEIGGLVDTYVMNFMKAEGMSNADTPTSVSQDNEDRVTNYACQVIGHGLMAETFHDGWREGDGGRLLRCWKFFLLHFRENGRTKYALEAF